MLSVRQHEPQDSALIGDWGNDNTLMYSDDHGYVVALKTTQVARLDFQFLTTDRMRNARALIAGFWAYVEVLRKRGIDELLVRSESEDAIRFFTKTFHFRHLGGAEYSLKIK
jgi:hypothetical protein